MSFKFRLSRDLLQAREAKGWTQPVVADLISITLRQYQNIESGKCIHHTDTFLKFVYLFDLDIENYREVLTDHVPLSAR